MKKFLLLFIIGINQINYGCNLCFGPTKHGIGRHSWQSTECHCDCAQYIRSDKNICTKCRHKVMAWSINPKQATSLSYNPFANNKLIHHKQKKKITTLKKTNVILLDQS